MTRPLLVTFPGSVPAQFPADDFSHSVFERLLQRHVDHDGRRIVLNTIFRWYRKDFVNDLRRRGLPGERGVIDYIAAEASAGLLADLENSAGYEVTCHDYDWALNAQES